jgi:hypothetical protein
VSKTMSGFLNDIRVARLTISKIIHCIANLDDWLQDEKVAVPTPFEYWSPLIRRRPKGTCLVIG